MRAVVSRGDLSLSRTQSVIVAAVGAILVGVATWNLFASARSESVLTQVWGTVLQYRIHLQPRSASLVELRVSYDWEGTLQFHRGYLRLAGPVSTARYSIGSPVRVYVYSRESGPVAFLQPPTDRRGVWLTIAIFGGLLVVGAYVLRGWGRKPKK